jgi:hypothetical protein
VGLEKISPCVHWVDQLRTSISHH